ncbi:MAG: DUF2330 domain-containing protein [bacterium]|nr:DUF2330 domain-containing protein [bacterium]
MKRILVMGLVVAAMAVQSLADGKMFWREEIPPEIPYQRALILFRDGTETLVLQSRYEIPEAHEKMTLGWVVPVPAVPEVASMSAHEASDLFWHLSRTSSPRITRISTITLIAILLLLLTVAGLSVLTLLLCLLSFVAPFSASFMQRRRKLCERAVLGLICCLYALLIMSIFIPATMSAGRSDGVDVIAEHRVGIYDVRVVRCDDSGELISWLNANKFKFGQQDTAVFNSYISKGWCFVVAVINPTRDQLSEIASEGLAAPLILRFPHANPVYPLALTGTGDFETEILIYLASDTKMSCDDRLKLRFAGYMYSGALIPLSVYTEPEGFFDLKFDERPKYPYLCKFKDRLTPAEMSKDIIFTPAKDKESYREHIVRW